MQLVIIQEAQNDMTMSYTHKYVHLGIKPTYIEFKPIWYGSIPKTVGSNNSDSIVSVVVNSEGCDGGVGEGSDRRGVGADNRSGVVVMV